MAAGISALIVRTNTALLKGVGEYARTGLKPLVSPSRDSMILLPIVLVDGSVVEDIGVEYMSVLVNGRGD